VRHETSETDLLTRGLLTSGVQALRASTETVVVLSKQISFQRQRRFMAVLIPASAKDSVANLAPNHLILCQEMEITSKLRRLCNNSLTVRNTTFWTNSIHLTRVKVHLCTWDSLTRQFKRWLWTCSSNLETLWASSKQKVWQTASSMVWILAVWVQRQIDLAFTQTSTRACICSSTESSDLFGTWRSPLLPLPKALTCKCLISKRCCLC